MSSSHDEYYLLLLILYYLVLNHTLRSKNYASQLVLCVGLNGKSIRNDGFLMAIIEYKTIKTRS